LVIKNPWTCHYDPMASSSLSGSTSAELDAPPAPPRAAAADERLRTMLAAHYDFIWRLLRRLGLPSDRAEDATQKVFFVASGRLDQIKADSERSFLFGTALRVASETRRDASWRREQLRAEPPETADPAPLADELIDRSRARALLDDILDAMEEDVRVVFVLFELEGLKTGEVAELLALPMGTVASRLRRARALFQTMVTRLRARGAMR
jgi:RNA polymerase sigma-70 factor (ECF subfamily)